MTTTTPITPVTPATPVTQVGPVAQVAPAAKMKFQTIDRAALKAKIDKKETFHLWNTLDKEHYKAESNIPGSKWIPVDAINEKLAAEKVPAKDATVVVYCGGGECPSSKQAAEKLASFGYSAVFAYEGGLKDWTGAGLGVVKL
ncbi:MAG: rhodanese-like domain-containing protein [Elusimicrobia bacterium]|nr:rhodanese-like domain-containing protein [Elusimicrobiota bacterium]